MKTNYVPLFCNFIKILASKGFLDDIIPGKSSGVTILTGNKENNFIFFSEIF